MGIYDRDYYRTTMRRNALGAANWSMTAKLIAVNVAVFLLETIMRRGWESPVERFGAFTIEDGVLHLQIWRFVTFQFLHASTMHLLFNMIGLYCFGRYVEQWLGASRYVAFYLLCGVGGALFYVLLAWTDVLRTDLGAHLVGASAGVFGVMVAAAIRMPEAEIYVFPLPVALPMRWAAVAFIGIAALTVLRNGANAGGEAGHLGGALVGYLLTMNPRALNLFDSRNFPRIDRPQWTRRRFPRIAPPPEEIVEINVDEILAKISREGLDSLSPAERAALERASRRRRDGLGRG